MTGLIRDDCIVKTLSFRNHLDIPGLSLPALRPPDPTLLDQLVPDLDHLLGRPVLADEPLQPRLVVVVPSMVSGAGRRRGRSSRVRVGAVRCGRGVVVPVDGGRGQGHLKESDEGDEEEAVSVQDQLGV